MAPDMEGCVDSMLDLLKRKKLKVAAFIRTAKLMQAAMIVASSSGAVYEAPACRRLCRGLAQIGSLLAALDARLLAADGSIVFTAGSGSHADLLDTACCLLVDACRQARRSGCSSAEAMDLCSAAALLLGSGTVALRWALQEGGGLWGQVQRVHPHVLAMQELLRLMEVRPDICTPAASLFPPAGVTRWLAAVTQSMLKVLDRGSAGTPVLRADFLPAYSAVCSALLVPHPGTVFGSVQAAVAEEDSLQQHMVSVLFLHCLPPALAGVAPPPVGGASQEHSFSAGAWHFLDSTLRVLVMRPEAGAQASFPNWLSRQPTQQQAVALRLAGQLLERLPLGCPATSEAHELTVWCAWPMAASLLSEVCSAVTGDALDGNGGAATGSAAGGSMVGGSAAGGSAVAGSAAGGSAAGGSAAAGSAVGGAAAGSVAAGSLAVGRPAAVTAAAGRPAAGTSPGVAPTFARQRAELAGHAVLRLLPRLAKAAHVLVGNDRLPAALTAGFLKALSGPVDAALFVCTLRAAASSWTPVLMAVTALVRLQPVLRRCWEAGMEDAAYAALLAEHSLRLVSHLKVVVWLANQEGQAGPLVGSPGDLAAAAAAAWQLHTSCCRLMHWLSSDAQAAWVAMLGPGRGPSTLLYDCSLLLQGLVPVLGMVTLGGPQQHAAAARALDGCHGAWWEALQVAAENMRPAIEGQQSHARRRWCELMLACAHQVPAALLHPACLHRLMTDISAALRAEEQPAERLAFAAVVLGSQDKSHSVHVTAALLSSGVAEELTAVSAADVAAAPTEAAAVVQATQDFFILVASWCFNVARLLHAGHMATSASTSASTATAPEAAAVGGRTADPGSHPASASASMQLQLLLGQMADEVTASSKAVSAVMTICGQATTSPPSEQVPSLERMTARVLPIATAAAALAQQHSLGTPEQQASEQLHLARAAATRSCAYLRCSNLGAEGGPGAGEQPGTRRCGGCRAVRYCDTTCSHADWRGALGHKRVCAALGAVHAAEEAGAGGEQQAGS